MKTIIVCGGLGYRLKEETEFKPKPMVSIGNKPILWHIMKIYSHWGFNEFIIALGYKGDYIKDYFLNQKYFNNDFTLSTKSGFVKLHRDKTDEKLIDDFKITFVNTGLETMVGERIRRVKEYIPREDDEFMVTYGDGVSNIDIKDLIRFHRKMNTIGTITGVYPRSKYGQVRIDKKNKITSFVEKPLLKDWTNGGFMIFKKEFFDFLRPGEMEHTALARLIEIGQLSLYVHKGFWHSMDTYSDVQNLNELWNAGAEWKVWK